MFDGLGEPKEHFDFVIKNTQDEAYPAALAITNHGHMSSFDRAYLYARDLKKKGVSFKYLPGCELYVHPDLNDWRRLRTAQEEGKEEAQHGSTVENEEETKSGKHYNPIKRRHHLVVLAKSSKGLQGLFSTVSRGYLEGFYRFPRVDYAMLKEHKGELVASSACIGGPLAFDLFENFQSTDFWDLVPSLVDDDALRASIRMKMEGTVDRLVDTFGPENFFLELQFNRLPAQHLVNRMLIELHRSTGVPLIATADSHYYNPDVWRERAIYKAIGWLNFKEYDPSHLPQSISDLDDEPYPKNAAQMWEWYSHRMRVRPKKQKEDIDFNFYDDTLVRDAIERTHDIAFDLIGDVQPDLSVKLPSCGISKGTSPDDVLKEMCVAGLKRLGLQNNVQYGERLEYELSVISEKEFAGYFILMKTIIDIAAERMLIGPGRGSAAGSLVNYVLGITQVDPLKYGLIFERFINPLRCLDPQLFVKTDVGPITLQNVNIGQSIMGRDGSVDVLAKRVETHRRLCKLVVGGRQIVCSPEHRWTVKREGKELEIMTKDLLLTDLLITK